MALVSPNYVQGNYTVAQRDAIFAKADKYPDASGALPNQVPMIFPDGTINWRQLSAGGETGTANANIAFVEETQYASQTYNVGDLLIYNGQLYAVISPINSGALLTPLDNIKSTRIDTSFLQMWNKGENLLRNWLFSGGGSQQGGGQFPINQRGATTYSAAGETIDRWIQTGGTTKVEANWIVHTSPAGASSDLYQIVDRPANSPNYGENIVFGAIINAGVYNWGSVKLVGTSGEVTVVSFGSFSLLLEAISDKKIKAIIRVSPGTTITIRAAKLEIGNLGTLARPLPTSQGYLMLYDAPPDYGEELAKCQRYLTPIKAGDLLHGINLNGTFYLEAPTHVQMAAAPTLTSALSLAIVAGGAVEVVSVPAATQGTVGGAGVGFTVGVSTIGNLQTAVAQVQADTLLSCE